MIDKICWILLLNLIFYFKTIYFSYVSDDVQSSNRPKEKNKFWQAFWVFEGKLKSTPQADHALTMVLHALVCVGIYLGLGKNDISFLAALLFAFNPINNQGAVWISGRGYVLSTLGMVWTLAIPVLGPLFLVGATYSNAGFIFPIVLAGSPHPELLLFMPVAWWFNGRRFKRNVILKINMEMYTEDKKVHPKKLILATKTFGFYLIHSIIPIKTSFYHSLLESIAGSKVKNAYSFCRFFWLGAVGLAVMLWYICTHRWDMISFGILWWCVGIAPFINLMRMQQELGERYAYLPNVGLMVILATFIHSYSIVVGAWLAVYATKTWFYINGYKDDYWLVEHARINCPDSWFAWHIAGMKRWEVGSRHEAMCMWTMAKILSPKEFKVLYNLSTALCAHGNIAEAVQFLKMAEDNIPPGQEKMATDLITGSRKNIETKGKEGALTILI